MTQIVNLCDQADEQEELCIKKPTKYELKLIANLWKLIETM